PQGSPLFPYDPHKLNKVGQIRPDVNSRVFLPTSASLQGPAGTWKNSVVTLPAHRCHRASVAAPPQWDRGNAWDLGAFINATWFGRRTGHFCKFHNSGIP